jgi:aminoglycoside N3'-acetyltransferase
MNSEDIRNKIKSQLFKLGVSEGDTLLIRADLGAIGKLSRDRLDYVNVILDAVGDSGTLVSLAFTGGSFIKKNIKNIFDGSNKANTGAFANIMLSHPKALRSQHPTNSYVAIGKYAEYVLDGHDERSGAYDPIRKIIELNGKMILIGCVESSPGFTTAHLAEVDLGLHKRIIFPTLNICYYRADNGDVKLFKRKDLGGCSFTFYKLYGHYVRKELLHQGYIGKAYSVLIEAQKAYEIDRNVLTRDPKFNICDTPSCFLCRARRWDNLKDMPMYIVRYLIPKALKNLRR